MLEIFEEQINDSSSTKQEEEEYGDEDEWKSSERSPQHISPIGQPLSAVKRCQGGTRGRVRPVGCRETY